MKRNKSIFQLIFGGKPAFGRIFIIKKVSSALAFRMIPSKIRTLEELNIPPALYELTKQSQGFVLINGSLRSWKINDARSAH